MSRPLYECQNCSGLYSLAKLVRPIPRLEERVAPGEIMPAGECPFCGSLCHKKEKEKRHAHRVPGTPR